MAVPAEAVKNPDATWSVHVQHTVNGEKSVVDFGNVVFAESLAKAYAATLNGTAKVDAVIGKAAEDVGAASVDLKGDIKKMLAEAEAAAKAILADAKTEASKVKAEASALYEETKNEADKLIEEAKAETAKILHAVAAKIEPAPAAPAAKPPVVEEE